MKEAEDGFRDDDQDECKKAREFSRALCSIRAAVVFIFCRLAQVMLFQAH